jgi:hypothetical protein
MMNLDCVTAEKILESLGISCRWTILGSVKLSNERKVCRAIVFQGPNNTESRALAEYVLMDGPTSKGIRSVLMTERQLDEHEIIQWVNPNDPLALNADLKKAMVLRSPGW